MQSSRTHQKVTLVTDWLVTRRGGEKVLEALADLFPGAPIYTLFHSEKQISPKLRSHPIGASVLNRLPLARRYYPYFLPLFPWAIGTLRLRPCDLVISVSHAVAKGVTVPGGARHTCYCLTPMRYLWQRRSEYFSRASWREAALAVFSRRLKQFDLRNDQVDRFLVVSRFVQQQVKQIYNREATVVYSPVDTDFFSPGPADERGEYFLVVGALVAYKRVDLAVEAFSRNGQRLIVVGQGPLLRELRRRRRSSKIEFRGWVCDQELRRLYRGARALVVTAKEDFGLAPLEANACATPVIALRAGGVCETMTESTAVLFDRQDLESLEQALRNFSGRAFQPHLLRANAQRFSLPVFQRRILEMID